MKYHGINSLAEIYAKKHNIAINDAKVLMRNFYSVLEEGLKDPESDGVQFVNLITLEKVVRKQRMGKNFIAKEVVVIPERLTYKAICGKGLIEHLNNN